MCHVSERLPWLGEGEVRAGVDGAAEGTAGTKMVAVGECSEAESDSAPSESAPEIKDV